MGTVEIDLHDPAVRIFLALNEAVDDNVTFAEVVEATDGALVLRVFVGVLALGIDDQLGNFRAAF